jgi:hypothetical protein
MPQATTMPGWTGAGDAVGVALSTAAVGVARAGVVAAVAVGTLAAVAVGTLAAVAVGTLAAVAVGTLAAVGVAPFDVQAATVASSPPMTAALEILNKASGCPIIWTPPVGTQGGAIARRPRLDERSHALVS